MAENETDVGALFTAIATEAEVSATAGRLGDAIDLASDQGQGTWLVQDGKRLAKIVPVDEAETAEKNHQTAMYAVRMLARIAETVKDESNLLTGQLGVGDRLETRKVGRPQIRERRRGSTP